MAYHPTDNITAWLRYTFEEYWAFAAMNQLDQEMLVLLLSNPASFGEWCDERIRLACPNMPNVLFVAICSSVDWIYLRAVLREHYMLDPD